jgi:ABC-type polysaccharide/polyol phosphate transport system ATPase subunit
MPLLALTALSATFETPGAEASPSPLRPAAVEVRDLDKTFHIPHRRYSTLKERVLHPFATRDHEELRAVNDVNFDVAPGEFFGIVGRNGSGKSTLLKCLAGIYRADRGHTVVRGRLSPFIELGVGFNPELSARDNVMVNAVMLGLTRKQARERFDEIIAFGELEEFLDLKLKNYSSGMSVRLAFSVAIQVDADVLLIDEVLAVGDAAFQYKCFAEFERLKAAGKTIVFVTHDMSSVERFCDRAMLLERGKIVSVDTPAAIARAYNEMNFGRVTPAAEPVERTDAPEGAGEIIDAWFEDGTGRRVAAVPHGGPLFMCAEVRFDATTTDPYFNFHLRNDARHIVLATTSGSISDRSGTFAAGEHVIARVAVGNWFTNGRYSLTPSCTMSDAKTPIDLREDLAHVELVGAPSLGGVMDLPYEFSLERP